MFKDVVRYGIGSYKCLVILIYILLYVYRRYENFDLNNEWIKRLLSFWYIIY